MKNVLVAAVLGTAFLCSAGTQTATAAPYRRPVIYRPYYNATWHRPYYVGVTPTVYAYPTYTYPAPAYAPAYTPAYAPYYAPGISVGLPSVGVRIGR